MLVGDGEQRVRHVQLPGAEHPPRDVGHAELSLHDVRDADVVVEGTAGKGVLGDVARVGRQGIRPLQDGQKAIADEKQRRDGSRRDAAAQFIGKLAEQGRLPRSAQAEVQVGGDEIEFQGVARHRDGKAPTRPPVPADIRSAIEGSADPRAEAHEPERVPDDGDPDRREQQRDRAAHARV